VRNCVIRFAQVSNKVPLIDGINYINDYWYASLTLPKHAHDEDRQGQHTERAPLLISISIHFVPFRCEMKRPRQTTARKSLDYLIWSCFRAVMANLPCLQFAWMRIVLTKGTEGERQRRKQRRNSLKSELSSTFA
jgi:hypothetical protein